MRCLLQTLANGLEVTPIGHSFKLLDSGEGHRRWLVQMPKPTPISAVHLTDSSDVDSKAHSEAPVDQTQSELDLQAFISPSKEEAGAAEDGGSSRCTYAMANFDLHQVVANLRCFTRGNTDSILNADRQQNFLWKPLLRIKQASKVSSQLKMHAC